MKLPKLKNPLKLTNCKETIVDTYSENNTVTSIISYGELGEILTFSKHRNDKLENDSEYTYDEYGRVTSEYTRIFDKDNKLTETLSRWTYAPYTDEENFDKVISASKIDLTTNRILYNMHIFTYCNGHMKVENDFAKGKRIIIRYDEHGNIIKRERTVLDPNKLSPLVESSYDVSYEFDEENRIISSVMSNTKGDVPNIVTTRTIKYND